MDESRVSTANNVASLMKAVARRQPEKCALAFEARGERQSISFGELWRQSSAFASGLHGLGIKTGDRVIVMIPMSIDLYVCLLGIIQLGAVVVFVDPWVGARQIARFSEFAEPHAFVGINKSHLLRWSSPKLRRIKISITNGIRIGPILARHSLDRLKQSKPREVVAAVSPDDSALITFTSGSSGIPKGANRTHRFLLSQHHALKFEFPYLSDDIDMPMFPVFALNNLVSGITSAVPDMDFRNVSEVDGGKILQQMVENNVTTCTASPPFFDNVAEALENASTELTQSFGIRRILTGGAPVRDEQLARWVEVFQAGRNETKIIVAYGSTEAEPVGHISAQERLQLATVGKGYCTGLTTQLIRSLVIPIVKGQVDLAEGEVQRISLPPGEVGELVVTGDHVCQEYYRNEEATRENKLTEMNGTRWHRMGDTGYFDDDGRFWLVGRVHSTIFRRGLAVHPQVIEQVVESVCPEAQQVAAVGYDQSELGEMVVIVVVVDDKQLARKDSITGRIRSELQRRELACDCVWFTQSRLPVDPRHQSKIDYGATRRTLPTSLEPQWPVNR